MEYDHLLKVLFVGDSGVGKSELLAAWADPEMCGHFVATIGVDFKLRTLEHEGKRYKLQLWDTAGQERFRTITSSYYRGAHGLVVIYDVTDMMSFNNLRQWVQEIERYATPNVVVLMIGNRYDQTDKRVVPIESAQEFAAAHSMEYVELTEKDTQGIEATMMNFTVKVIEALHRYCLSLVTATAYRHASAQDSEANAEKSTAEAPPKEKKSGWSLFGKKKNKGDKKDKPTKGKCEKEKPSKQGEKEKGSDEAGNGDIHDKGEKENSTSKNEKGNADEGEKEEKRNAGGTDEDTVDAFLTRLNLERLIDLFHEHEVEYEDLRLLKESDLEKMGVKIGPKNRILEAVQQLPRK